MVCIGGCVCAHAWMRYIYSTTIVMQRWLAGWVGIVLPVVTRGEACLGGFVKGAISALCIIVAKHMQALAALPRWGHHAHADMPTRAPASACHYCYKQNKTVTKLPDLSMKPHTRVVLIQ